MTTRRLIPPPRLSAPAPPDVPRLPLACQFSSTLQLTAVPNTSTIQSLPFQSTPTTRTSRDYSARHGLTNQAAARHLGPHRLESTRPLNSHSSCSRHIDDPRRADSLPVDIPRPDSSPPSPIDKTARNDPRQLDHPIPANTGHFDSAPHLTARQPRASRPTISQPVISYHLDFSRQFASTRYSSTYQAVVTPCPRPATRRFSSAQDRAQPIDGPEPNTSPLANPTIRSHPSRCASTSPPEPRLIGPTFRVETCLTNSNRQARSVAWLPCSPRRGKSSHLVPWPDYSTSQAAALRIRSRRLTEPYQDLSG